MISSGTKRTFVLLGEKQIDFLNRLAKEIEKEGPMLANRLRGRDNMGRCEEKKKN
jgi:hypothetical protein